MCNQVLVNIFAGVDVLYLFAKALTPTSLLIVSYKCLQHLWSITLDQIRKIWNSLECHAWWQNPLNSPWLDIDWTQPSDVHLIK